MWWAYVTPQFAIPPYPAAENNGYMMLDDLWQCVMAVKCILIATFPHLAFRALEQIWSCNVDMHVPHQCSYLGVQLTMF